MWRFAHGKTVLENACVRHGIFYKAFEHKDVRVFCFRNTAVSGAYGKLGACESGVLRDWSQLRDEDLPRYHGKGAE